MLNCLSCKSDSNYNDSLQNIFKLIFIANHNYLECLPNPKDNVKDCHCVFKFDQIELLKLNIKITSIDKDTTIYFSPIFYLDDTCCAYQQRGVKKYGFVKNKGFFPLDYADAILPEKYYFHKNNTNYLLRLVSFDFYIKSKGKTFFDRINKKHFNSDYDNLYRNTLKLFHQIGII